MSRIGDIRAALETLFLTASGINVFHDYPPTSISINGTAWVETFKTRYVMSGKPELHVHEVNVRVIANRNATVETALEATEPVLEAMLAKIRGRIGLGLANITCKYVASEQGIWEIGGSPYVGFQLTLEVQDTVFVTYEE